MEEERDKNLLYLIAIGAGVFIELATSLPGARISSYTDWPFIIGHALICITSFCLAYYNPTIMWPWAILPMLSQFLTQFVIQVMRTGELGNLWPLAPLFVLPLLVIPTVVATIGQAIGNWKKATSSKDSHSPP